jgi:ABC-type transporter Mla maintaining outer membrane lipid asymmetry ATPase subunit MlaF
MEEYLLRLEHLSYSAGGHDALFDVSLDLKKGENMVLFGPENSGIETILMMVLDLEETYEGAIYYKNVNIKDLGYAGRRTYKREIGYVHGLYGLMSNMSVEDNISLPLEYHSSMGGSEIKEHVSRLVYELNLDSCKKFRPVDLSRSEMLRTSYARAIALDPDLLLVEHAFQGQSPLNIHSFSEHLRERAARPDRSLVIVTDEPEKFVDFSDRFVMIFAGASFLTVRATRFSIPRTVFSPSIATGALWVP